MKPSTRLALAGLGTLLPVVLAACATEPQARPEPWCGPPVAKGEVAVIDLSAPEDEQAAQQQAAGEFVLASTVQMTMSFSGSRAGTIQKAAGMAARRGCDVLLLGGFRSVEVENRTGGVDSGRVRQYREELVFRFAQREG